MGNGTLTASPYRTARLSGVLRLSVTLVTPRLLVSKKLPACTVEGGDGLYAQDPCDGELEGWDI